MKPFERQPNESLKAYEAFRIYRDAGEKRSTRAVAKALSKSATLVQRWCGRHCWIKRARAFDENLELLASQSEELALKKDAATWAARIRAVRQKDWEIAQELRKKAAQILARRDGKGSLADAIRAADLASRLERLSCGLATSADKVEVSGPDGAPLGVTQAVQIFLPDNRRGSPPVHVAAQKEDNGSTNRQLPPAEEQPK